MERLKHMKEMLMNCVQGQMGDLASADGKELGEAIDMIKDLSEAIYYCQISKAMEEEEHSDKKYMMMPYNYNMRDTDKHNGRMYYDDGMYNYNYSNGNGTAKTYPVEIRDAREGRSPMTRRNYMENKELHRGTAHQMQELEKYMHELSEDLTEMIQGASPEEKQLLQKKLSTLATKIV